MEVHLRVIAGPHEGLEQIFEGAGRFQVGRSPDLELSMPNDRLLSRSHFQLEINPPLCDLLDRGSTNGTKVNGLRVERIRLRDGDVIEAGDSEFAVMVAETLRDLGDGPPLRCAVCGVTAPTGLTPSPTEPHWLCESCEAIRQSFPATRPDYFIERELGGGGMGDVYLARELATNRPVALKMMEPTGGASEKAKAYFRREMDVLKDLLMPGGHCHPNIVAFYDMFEIGDQFQLVMEFVPGKNALEWINGLEEPLPAASAARIGILLLNALEHAHGKGYVHRDVKPSNLLIWGPVARPRVKLSDFGLAKSFRENAGFVNLTRQGDVGGSIGFISPDHIRGFREAKEPADIYSAGATLYYMLTRRYPFLNFDPYKGDAYNMILEDPVVPLRAFRPDTPEGLGRVLARALAKQPKDRWKTAREMAVALRPFVREPD
ncbi:MAG: protein kinase [Isosphaeraceae bacterium]